MKLHEKFNTTVVKEKRKWEIERDSRRLETIPGQQLRLRSNGDPSLQMHTIKYLQMADLQKFVI